jgi:hypothetical protein
MIHALAQSQRAVIAAALLSLGLLSSPLLLSHAAAGLVTCGTDPEIVLSNGKTVIMAVTINDQASDVQSISFVLHGPAGASVTSIIGDSTFAGLEGFQYLPDNSSSYSYTSDILVVTGTATTATGTTTITNQSGTARTMSSMTSTTGQHLITHLFLWG